ncbi:PTS sugar transporter subunit IIB [Treponema phagedenis]|uniref:PTS sugar transporter subunit IIB n=1 Tax=Treponema phagedenis TaxID=162 RepID=A0A0B7GUK2_TREPH|nr:PTS sugar transporter subunit IIB [Treponema phagedenis]EFW37522.1 PTS system, Lactose/Cellobiose specific IIB subunit [Treponema phagedenis F0421]NVP23361.1 PTS sugar transporter subunit IIB [Treponema phagedenis]QEJ95583.1 PTS sugar transporter subunit IIB [Treponema phagedenis]QEJ98505.1 PTS sugar transporter subunit IIB [Treponema phagedenis]QEK01435.1 PTS sugar transporter subunit IIB [Treponema phagedenis]
MIKIVVACGSGMGSSQIIKMKMAKVLKKLNIAADIHHTNIGEAKSTAESYHAVVCPENLMETFTTVKAKGVKVIALKNLLDEKEIEGKILEADLASLK